MWQRLVTFCCVKIKENQGRFDATKFKLCSIKSKDQRNQKVSVAEQVVPEVVLINCRFFMNMDAEKVKKEHDFSMQTISATRIGRQLPSLQDSIGR